MIVLFLVMTALQLVKWDYADHHKEISWN